MSFPESNGKGSNDLVLLSSCKGVKEGVMADSDASKVLGETVPRSSVVLVCASCNCSRMGSISSNAVSHKLILSGSGAI